VTLTAMLRLLPSRQPSHHFRVLSFGRVDATLSRVEKASALTPARDPDFPRSLFNGRCQFLRQVRHPHGSQDRDSGRSLF